MSVHKSIVDFVSGLGRLAYTRDEIAMELNRLGRHGCDWPRASESHWRREIDSMIANGVLEEINGAVRIPKERESRVVQGSLF